MSQSETHFDIAIDDLNPAEVAFWEQLVHALEHGNSLPLVEMLLNEESIHEFLSGINIAVEDHTVTIISEGDGDANNAAELIRVFLSEFAVSGISLHEPIIFEMAMTGTSTPGGVGFHITADGYTTLSTAEVAQGVLIPHAVIAKLRDSWKHGENVTSIDLALAVQDLFKAVDGV